MSSLTLEYIREMEHGILAYSGSGKQGKSATMHGIIHSCYADRPKYLLDPFCGTSIFPGYEIAKTVNDVPPDSVAVIEDINRIFPSRGSGSNNTLQRWIGIISHKGIVVCFTSQNLADTDLSLFRSQDLILCMKFMHWEDIAFEREEFRVYQTSANVEILRARSMYGKDPSRSWTYFPRFQEVVSTPLPPWWSKTHSHYLREASV